MIVVLCGKSGSGKSRICQEMMRRGWVKIITYTTRPPRPNETNHLDYEFVTEEEFKAMFLRGEFIESRGYSTGEDVWFYGSLRDDYLERGNFVVVLTPDGAAAVKGALADEDIKTVLIESDPFVLRHRLKRRGDDKTEIKRRMAADDVDFADFKADYHFRNALFTDPEKLAKKIIKTVGGAK